MKDWKPKQVIPKTKKLYSRDDFSTLNSGDVVIYTYRDDDSYTDFIGVVLERRTTTYYVQDIFSFKDGAKQSTFEISHYGSALTLKKFMFTLPEMHTCGTDILNRVKRLYPEYMI